MGSPFIASHFLLYNVQGYLPIYEAWHLSWCMSYEYSFYILSFKTCIFCIIIPSSVFHKMKIFFVTVTYWWITKNKWLQLRSHRSLLLSTDWVQQNSPKGITEWVTLTTLSKEFLPTDSYQRVKNDTSKKGYSKVDCYINI